MFATDLYEVRFCDDDGDCPAGTNCRFWLGEVFVFACTAPPDDDCEGFVPELVCGDDTDCPACRPTCRVRGRDRMLSACSF